MDEENWIRVKEIFWEVLEQPENLRAGMLQTACGGNENLLREVKSLLAANHESKPFLLETNNYNLNSILSLDNKKYAGKSFGHYKIISEIGRGGMGTVFLAERSDGEFRQQVALKIVRQTTIDVELEKRFKRERQILASLNHPYIAKLLDGGVSADGELFLAMEYVEGESVLEFAEKRNLSVEQRLDLFNKICSALAYAHRNLIVHLDIKPSNILVTNDGEPKLLDFGLAKFLDTELFEQDTTQTAFRAFTVAYASPEQIKGTKLTTASDVYSLSVVLYELLTGSRPFHFENKSLEDILKNVDNVEPQKPSDVLSSPITKRVKGETSEHQIEVTQSFKRNLNSKSLVGDLDTICLTGLRKEPEQRYVSVERLAEDINLHLKGLPILARPQTFTYQASKFIQRNKAGVLTFSLLILSLLIGLTVSLWQASAARKQRDIAQQEKLRAERINKFLQQTLSFSNQSYTSVSPVSSTRNVTVNEMLDNIAPQIETELSDQPEVLAQVLRTIGSSYASLGNYASAEKFLREALAAQNLLYGENSSESAATMFELGVLSYRQSKFEESNQLLEKVVNFYRSQQQSGTAEFNPAKLAQALDHLGVARFYIGNTQGSLAAFNEALQTASNANLQGREREVLASAETNLGGVLITLGEIEKGENLLHQGAAEYRLVSQEPHWELGANLASLGASANNRNQPDEALGYLLESEQILRQTLGDKNMYLAGNINQQANSYLLKKDYQTAEAKARESLAMYKDIFQTENTFTARSLTTLGDVLTKKGNAQEAESLLRRAVEIFVSQPKKNYVYVIRTKNILGESLLTQNHDAEAEKFLLETYEEAKQNLPDNNQLIKAAAANLVKLYEKQGKFDLAQKYK